jgi:hypothetical protein
LLTSLVVFCSHPFDTFPSQSPYPAPHAILHTPAAQLAVPPTDEHALPHAPQLPALVPRFVSHPLSTFPSQSPYPAAQAILHPPSTQLAVPFFVEHTFPHAPQFAASLPSAFSHPLAALPSQLPKPALHAIWHADDTQLAVPLIDEHTLPHAPQLLADCVRSTSHPFCACPSQLPCPTEHTVVHAPATHVPVPPTDEHAALHAPQLSALVFKFVSQPFDASPSQSA